MGKLIPDPLGCQRLTHKAAGSGAPGVKGVSHIGSKVYHIGGGIDGKKGMAEIEPAHRPDLDVQKCQCDPVCLCTCNGLGRSGEAVDPGSRKSFLQNREAPFENDLTVVLAVQISIKFQSLRTSNFKHSIVRFSFPMVFRSCRKYLDCSGHLAAQLLAERWPSNACWCKHRMRSPAYRSNENSPKVLLPKGCRHVSFFCFLEPSHA